MSASYRLPYVQIGLILQALSSIPSSCEIRPHLPIAAYGRSTDLSAALSIPMDRLYVSLQLSSIMLLPDQGCPIQSAAAVDTHDLVLKSLLLSHARGRELPKNPAMRLRNPAKHTYPHRRL
ncbi:uncharacterized protein K489DRAFT_372945 [Dissoconium aciculare CBS 342.82]|uniref:Uncharacterized protein n=1 Tax=Dissoconium aciculare CBS 342.82 TaxID=1314786 RepID=A0A6J3LVA3_9PEZI|nr:uncharacterized protein K489DRAFT_372945 [Dissoconium aciculare CBS 342.82]KAF1819696.1 hypothetical protein K489DRAFT_372945 [Dissoconium aciculare CBS 342.82]